MQLLAYLGDSYREAKSGWVLQTMLGLLALLVLAVASISFQPINAADTIALPLRMFQQTIHLDPQYASLKYEVENVTLSNPKEPWNSSHDYDIVMSADSRELIEKIQKQGAIPSSKKSLQRFIGEEAKYFKNVVVTELPGNDVKQVRFHVTAAGTEAPDITAWPHIPTLFFALEAPLFTMSLRQAVYTIESYVMSGVGAWILLFISVVISAGFIPTLLQKGSFDLAVTKPISRSRLLAYKYLGGLIYIAILTTFAVAGSYLAISLRSGIWNHYFLFAIPIIVMYFAILYAVSTLTAVFTRSTIVCILVTLLAWLLMFVIGKVNNKIEARFEAIANPTELKMPTSPEDIDPDAIMAKLDPDSPIWGFIPKSLFKPIHALAFISPRTYQLDDRLSRLIAEGALTPAELKQAKFDKPYPHSWLEILGVSFAFIGLMLAIACWKLQRRDG